VPEVEAGRVIDGEGAVARGGGDALDVVLLGVLRPRLQERAAVLARGPLDEGKRGGADAASPVFA
jgi:hypothetical protein